MAAPITAEQLAEFLELEERRRELDRQSRALGKQASLLCDHFKAGLDAAGKDTVTRGGYRVSLVDGRPSVAWREQFIALAGPLRAAEVTSAAPVPKRIVVDPPVAEQPKRARRAA